MAGSTPNKKRKAPKRKKSQKAKKKAKENEENLTPEELALKDKYARLREKKTVQNIASQKAQECPKDALELIKKKLEEERRLQQAKEVDSDEPDTADQKQQKQQDGCAEKPKLGKKRSSFMRQKSRQAKASNEAAAEAASAPRFRRPVSFVSGESQDRGSFQNYSARGGSGNRAGLGSNKRKEKNSRIVVTGLAPSATVEELEDVFRPFGQVAQLRMIPERGTGVVRYQTHEEATIAMEDLHQSLVCGAIVRVKQAGEEEFNRVMGDVDGNLGVNERSNVPHNRPLMSYDDVF